MKKLKRETAVYGVVTRQQIATLDFMTRNTTPECELAIALICETYDDDTSERLLVVTVSKEIQFFITHDGRIRTAVPE